MSMSAWGLLAAPLMAAQNPMQATAPADAATVQPAGEFAAGDDIFGGFSALDESAMSEQSGGTDTAIDIGVMGVNIADNTGTVSDTITTNSPTGEIAGNLVSDNGGITTVFNNTGNGVIFQSTVNVNIFMDAAQ